MHGPYDARQEHAERGSEDGIVFKDQQSRRVVGARRTHLPKLPMRHGFLWPRPRKVVLGGLMYSGLGGMGYYAADAIGKSIVRVRQMQIGGEAAKKASQEGPSLGKVLEAMPSWFPIRKISAEEIEERQREMERQADEEAAKARQRWAAANPEVAAEVQAEIDSGDNAR